MKVIIAASYVRSLINFRSFLLEELIKLGHDVIVLAPVDENYSKAKNILAKMGISLIEIPLARTKFGIFSELKTICKLSKYIEEFRPDVFLAYTIKPVIYRSSY